MKMIEVALRAGKEVIYAQNLIPSIEETIDQMRTQKPGSARN